MTQSASTDRQILVQPFCTKAQFLKGKAKVDLIEKVAGMVVNKTEIKGLWLCSGVSLRISLLLLFLLLFSRTCDRGLPLQASDCGAQSAALALAPPQHLYPQGIHSLQEWQFIFCHHQTVPSPLCPDGAQPDRLVCLSVCHCPRPLK